MEHYRTTFQPASSSNHSFGQTLFPLSTVQAPAFDEHRGEADRGGFTSSKGKEETASLDSSHLHMETEGTSDSDDEKKKPAKKKSEKKVQRHKYAFQTRTQVDILDDGYRWRKYGQKAVKNSRFPRSYYRCTHQGCKVKKQVQRLSKDEGVVVTTYEGQHTHSIEKLNDNFEQILGQMRIFTNI